MVNCDIDRRQYAREGHSTTQALHDLFTPRGSWHRKLLCSHIFCRLLKRARYNRSQHSPSRTVSWISIRLCGPVISTEFNQCLTKPCSKQFSVYPFFDWDGRHPWPPIIVLMVSTAVQRTNPYNLRPGSSRPFNKLTWTKRSENFLLLNVRRLTNTAILKPHVSLV